MQSIISTSHYQVFVRLFISFFLASALSGVLHAQNYELFRGTWSDPSDWVGGVVPPNPLPENATILVTGNAKADIDGLVIGPTNTLTTDAVLTLDLPDNGTFVNDGIIILNNDIRVGLFNDNNTFINNGTLTINSGAVLDNRNDVVNSATGVINNQGVLRASNADDDSFLNEGTINSSGSGELELNGGGSFTNNGPMSFIGSSSIDIRGPFTNNADIDLTNGATSFFNRSAFINSATGSIDNAGSFIATNSGTHSFDNFGPFNNNGFGSVISNGIFLNTTTINNAPSATFENSGVFSNTGTINNEGDFDLSDDNADSFTNDGTFNNLNFGDVFNNGTFTNNSSFNNAPLANVSITNGTLVNSATGIIDNEGDIFSDAVNFTNNNDFLNDGDFINDRNFTNNDLFNNNGSLINEQNFTNNSQLINTALATIDNNNQFTNNTGATISNLGVFDAGDASSHTLDNFGLFTNEGSLSSDGLIFNGRVLTNTPTGSISSSEDLENATGASLFNEGAMNIGIQGGDQKRTTNNGNWFNSPGSSLNNSGRFVNNDLLDNQGNIITGTDAFFNRGEFIHNGTFLRSSGIARQDNTNGMISGTGSFDLNEGELELNQGTISPGNSIGTMTITGDLSIGTGMTVIAELQGDGTSDQIIVSGTADLRGTLSLLIGEGEFNDGEIWTVVNAGTVTRSFQSLAFSFPPGVPTTPTPPTFIDSYTATTADVTYSGTTFLPVELASFTGKAVKQAVQLDWITASESNNDYFDIQRSGEELMFQTIGRIDGEGTTLRPQTYRFIDDQPLDGVNYYRLRQVDFDGTEHFSNVIAVDIERPIEGLEIKLFPNPVSDRLQLSWRSAQTSDGGWIRLVETATGKEVKRYDMPQGEGRMEIPVDHLSAGFYFVQIVQGNLHQTSMFVKQ